MTGGNDTTRNRISGALIQLRAKAAFFGVLAMHADYVEDRSIPTAATDGRTIFYNPEYMDELTGSELMGILLHEVLHCAYLHITRRGLRDPLRWNIAADYVVNAMVPEVEGAELPAGLLYDAAYEGRRVEEVYDMLPKDLSGLGFASDWLDILKPVRSSRGQGGGDQEAADGAANQDAQGDAGREGAEDGANQEKRPPKPSAGDLNSAHETYWRNAINGAVQAHRMNRGMGSLPAGVELMLQEVAEAHVNWRDVLRDYTVHHPFDYGEYDLRLVGRGIYEEQLEGERLELSVCLDTSGSCVEWIPRFMGELRALLHTFPHVSAQLYYADAALYGPFEVERYEEAPKPKGGGGTDFRPFFAEVGQHVGPLAHHVLVYLTDGYGYFPAEAPPHETVWVVTPGGLKDDQFPFGRTVKLGTD